MLYLLIFVGVICLGLCFVCALTLHICNLLNKQSGLLSNWCKQQDDRIRLLENRLATVELETGVKVNG